MRICDVEGQLSLFAHDGCSGKTSREPSPAEIPRGEDFRIVLEETARVVDPACHVPRPAKGQWLGAGYLLSDGFSIAWRTVDAQFFGVPQRRRRIALVADFAGLCAPEVLFIDDGLPGYYPEGQSPREAFARSLAAGA